MFARFSSRRRLTITLAGFIGSAFALLFMAQPVWAQQQDGGAGQAQNLGQNQGQGRGQRRGGGGGGQRNGGDPAQFRQRMDERMKQTLGASDEEWAVLGPKIEKVRAAQRQVGGGGGRGMFFGGGRRGNGPGGAGGDGAQDGRGRGGDQADRGGRGGRGPGGQEDNSPVAVKSRELRQSVEANAGPEELKAKMAALRDARTAARQQLEQARSELRELLTAKQEAALMVMGVLE